MTILPNEPIATVSPYLYGQFAEHLGELVYPGIWVGENSAIPNTNGIRNDVVEALKPIHLPVLRWPGGCFADGYHWRDGIGPRAQRPMRINYWWGMAPEPNHFGTHEFIEFCRAIGAEPYFTGNVGSGTPKELGDWVEYCNFGGDSNLTAERKANGSAEPFGIKFWAVGNESWGCGGWMDPEFYASMFSRFRTFMFDYSETKMHAIACGAPDSSWDWTRRFMNTLKTSFWNRMHMAQSLAAHFYCGSAGTATDYTEAQWLELLAKGAAMEGIVTGHRQVMDEFDPERKISLIVDEWGTWHPVETGKPNSGLYQQNTIRDACVAALTFDVFNNHADKIFMANMAQLINVLQSLLLVQEDRCVKTPTYHVWDLYQPHKSATAVRCVCQSETISDGGEAREFCRRMYLDKGAAVLRAVQGSASVKDGRLCVTACNTHPTQPVELELNLAGATLGKVEVVRLAADDIHAHNTFERPDHVTLSAPETITAKGGMVRVTMPAGSIARVMGLLG